MICDTSEHMQNKAAVAIKGQAAQGDFSFKDEHLLSKAEGDMRKGQEDSEGLGLCLSKPLCPPV